MHGRLHAGFLVHILTASGAALALLALDAAIERRWSVMFGWLSAALVVDAADGPLARYFRIADTLPRWSGDTLDLVVDFVTYVFVPAYAIAASGLIAAPLDTAVALAIVITGALYFADRRMKTHDNFFRGFPAVWNCVAFYLLLLRPPSVLAAACAALLAALTFVPIPFVHPLRVERLRPFNIALLVVWTVLGFVALMRDLSPDGWITAGLCAIAVYFVAFGLVRAGAGDKAP